MTPKDKAIELINKYHSLELIELTKITDGLNIGITSKKCALIAVDEILESHYKVLLGVDTSIYNYWQEVKKEITKL